MKSFLSALLLSLLSLPAFSYDKTVICECWAKGDERCTYYDGNRRVCETDPDELVDVIEGPSVAYVAYECSGGSDRYVKNCRSYND